MNLVTVTVSGETLYSGNALGEVSIEFDVNESVELNTAESGSTTTDVNGSYDIDLQPGLYNVTLTKSITQGSEETVAYEGFDTLVLTKGQGASTKDFTLEKKTVTVSGKVSYDGNNIENVTVNFLPVNFTLDINSATVLSDEEGSYSVELMPVSGEDVEYNLTAIITNITGNDYNYYWTEIISISEDDIQTGVAKNIILERKQD